MMGCNNDKDVQKNKRINHNPQKPELSAEF